MNETTTPYVERRPEGDGHTHLCFHAGEFIDESTPHFVIDGEVWCKPCTEATGLA